jgi:putative membrane-bound dehydrogenase-like protein
VLDPSSYEADPRLEITLWAKEPAVVDPVAICFDAFGRAYVAECRDYPYGKGPDGKVGSSIRLLEDTRLDGQADRSVVFAEDLSYVTGLTPWRDGLLVAAAPDILFLRDTNGDGVADERRVILTGFGLDVSDSLLNGLRFHLDNTIHGANGGSSGRLTSPNKEGDSLDLRYDDFAFDPDTGTVWRTGASGGGFGLVFDDWGRFFTTYNIDHIQHRFMTRTEASRHPGLPPMNLTHSISDHGEMARIFPISEAQTRPNHPEQAGHFSSAGGMGYVGSSVWPADLQGSVFVCDVVGNLVHRDVIHPKGPVFVASRAPEEQAREFFASRDVHFRPVGLETGPDGALYLLDMQREVIEHPDYIPPKMREAQDIRAGDNRGRIYRLTPKGGLPVRPVRLGAATDVECVEMLAHPDQWWRLNAQRLLIERGAKAVAPELKNLQQRQDSPLGRMHALWTLAGLELLTPETLVTGLTDENPRVQENALQLASTHFLEDTEVTKSVLQLGASPDARVRFRTALALANRPSADAVDLWVRILEQDSSEVWTRRALWSVLPPDQQRKLFQKVLEHKEFRNAEIPGARDTFNELADLVGARAGVKPEDVAWVILQLEPALPKTVRLALMDGLAAGLARSGAQITLASDAKQRLESLFQGVPKDELRALWLLSSEFDFPETPQQARAMETALAGAVDPKAALDLRLQDIALLQFGSVSTTTPVLLNLFNSREPTVIQSTAFEILRRNTDPEIGKALVQRWRSLTPSLRGPVLQLLLDRRSYHDALMTAIESGQLTLGELNLDLEQRRRLLRQSSAEIRARAAQFYSDDDYGNRNALVEEWMAKLPGEGNAERGREYFVSSCAQCHRVGDEGYRVGPDLTAMGHRSVEDLLSNILDPNMAINPAYVVYEAETVDGEVYYGLLTAESTEAVTLLQAMEERVVLPRNKLVELRSTGRSLMPDGLEVDHTPQDMRDLIEFLQAR